MATEGATSITELDPTRPASTEPVGEIDDHAQMTKLVLKNTFVDQPSDAWDDAAPLVVGPRQINGWEARLAAEEAATAAAPATYVDVAGDTMTGLLVLSADATAALNPMSKQQTDALIAGLQGQIDTLNTTVASLQTQIDNLIDGTTKFTGAQEAPDFTAV